VLLSVVYLNQGLDIVKRITEEEKIIQVEIKIEDIADSIASETFAVEGAVISHFSLNTASSESRVRASLDKIQQYASQGKLLSPSRAEAFERIGGAISEYTATFSAVNQKLQLSRASPNTPTVAFSMENQAVFEQTFERLRKEIQDAANEISALSWQQIEQRRQKIEQYGQESRRKSEQSERNVITAMMLSLFIGGVFVFGLTRRLIRPLQQITYLINHVKAGAPNPSIPLKGKDEIGQLARAITQFMQKFNTYDVLKVQKIREQERLLQTVCNLSGIGLLVLDMDGHLLAYNQLILDLTIGEDNQLFGKDIEKILFDHSFVRTLRDSLKSLAPIDAVDFSLKRKNGAETPVTIHVGFFNAEGSEEPSSAVVIIWGLSSAGATRKGG
jgi:HAMP domain-containing protein